uniref:Uncharacterized protein n=1 Tax=Triticum urartu TaxID=4572 RepID=A0A8R7VH43_TRIUA
CQARTPPPPAPPTGRPSSVRVFHPHQKSPSLASHGSLRAAAHQKEALVLPDAAFLKHLCAPKVNATQLLPPATPPTGASGSEGTRRQRVGDKCTGDQLPGKCWNRASKCMRGRP